MESSAFHLLHPELQRWIWRMGWTALRDAQEQAIPVLLAGKEDVVIAAATASGKTEAAFLPILSRLMGDSGEGVRTLYVSPLKALINDQFQRLDLLCEELAVPVFRWHGDVGRTAKRKVLTHPAGILIITPESLEALFVLRGPEVARLFAALSFVVVDELHAFLGSERGAQLQSLLHRLELALRRRVPRIGLSATLGDLSLACEFLRPGGGGEVIAIESKAEGQELRLQVRGYRRDPPRLSAAEVEEKQRTGEPVALEEAIAGDELSIGHHLFKHLRGGHHLIFANARGRVEELADLLRRLAERERVPNEFWPHHGSLSKDLREDAEAAIKDRSRPASAVCTTTLELGIDIGAIESVAQVGPPPSVASLRQRLGRSGRAGGPAVLRVYLQEPRIEPTTPLHATLRADLVETVAKVDLLLAGWCEVPDPSGLHLSTLVQQLLSLIAQHGAVRAEQAFQALCAPGPFARVTSRLFSRFLRTLGSRELIQQDGSGELLLGPAGERLVNHYSFYAAFSTPEEYRLMAGGRALGSLPISFSLFPGLHLIFAGRRWVVVGINEEQRVIDLKPAAGGRPPAFTERAVAPVADHVRQEMLRVYGDTTLPRYLDATARELLGEGRENFYRHRLHERSLLREGDRVLFFPWRGDRVMDTLVVWLASLDLSACREGVALVFNGAKLERVAEALSQLREEPLPDPLTLGSAVTNKAREKYHPLLSPELLTEDYAATCLDLEGARGAVEGSSLDPV